MKTRELKMENASMVWTARCAVRTPQRGVPTSIWTACRGLRALPLGLCVSALMLLSGLAVGQAQSYSVDWYTVAGGGGTSTGGTFQVSGTIGQHDAGGPMPGGSYSLNGGFWAIISVIQTPGLPNLIVTHSGNSVIVSWPDPATNSYTLQQNGNVGNAAGWATSGYAITTVNGTNSITVNPPTGNLFFRLKQ